MKNWKRLLAVVVTCGFCLGILGHAGVITIDPKLTGRATVAESSASYSWIYGEELTILLAEGGGGGGGGGGLLGWILAGIGLILTAIFAGCSDSEKDVE